VREQIVRDYRAAHGLKLTDSEIRLLAARTRGKIERDIVAAVASYVETGVPPAAPVHPTNTCDPHTGNWAEHLMDPESLALLLEVEGFSARVAPGFWWRPSRPLKRVVNTALNAAITVLGAKGCAIAPFYTLYARRHRAAATSELAAQ
jgi:hypothetical protein